MVGRQLPFFSLIVPFWLIWAYAGRRGMLGVWPAILVAGASFAMLQFLVSNFHGPWLVDILAAIGSIGAVVLFLRVWQPSDRWTPTWGRDGEVDGSDERHGRAATRAKSFARGCRGSF